MMSDIPKSLSKVGPAEINKEVLRAGMIAELDAVSLYEQLAAMATNNDIKKVLLDIAKEEKTHMGEFQALLLRLDREQADELEEGRQRSLIKRVAGIYGLLTVAGIALLLLTGIGVFDSLATGLSAISTGGFSTKDANIAAYQNVWVEGLVMLLMVIGATSFLLIEGLTRGNFMDYLKSAETRLFWGLIIAFTVLLSFAMFNMAEPARHGLFQAVSALTTGGFTTLTTAPSGLVMLLLLTLMIIGGFGASAAGGLKLSRAGIMAKAFPWIGKKVTLPQEAIVPLKYDGRVVKDSEATIVAVFTAIYVLFLFGSAILLSFMGYQPLDSLYQTASAQGNVGLSVIPMDTINPAAKVLLMCNMILGRLEIFPVLGFLYVLVKTRLGRKDIISG